MRAESFPAAMGEAEFRDHYRKALEEHSPVVVARLAALFARTDLSPDVQRLDLEVFPDEYGEGLVSVCAYVEGPSRKVSKSDKSLYCGACVQLTDDLRVPLHDPDGYDFSTPDASAATVIEWFSRCWRDAGGDGYALPATIVGHEGVGAAELRPLNAAARSVLAPRAKSQRR